MGAAIMQIIRNLADLHAHIAALRQQGGGIGFVPTMGALHAGHLALVAAAKARARHVVTSIFVNPAQFGPNEDFDAYPRTEAADAAKLLDAGVSLLWAPPVSVIYPAGHSTRVSVAGLDSVLCGAARPGHFDGVATIVTKLFHQVAPDFALFGEKDWQQLAIIRRMTRDLDLAVEIIGVPTVREGDGLALSSRNAYLSEGDRAAAAALPRALRTAIAAIVAGEEVGDALRAAKAAILAAGFASVDYLDLRDGESLESCDSATKNARIFVAARIGATRLIDNMKVTS